MIGGKIPLQILHIYLLNCAKWFTYPASQVMDLKNNGACFMIERIARGLH